jgi:TolB protein
MKPKLLLVLLLSLLAAGALVMTAQNANFNGVISAGSQLKLAVPDFRGTGEAQKFMQVFNDTLWNELDNGGVVKLVGKSLYPLNNVPQRPEDFVPPAGMAKLTDWSGPPVQANDLAFGYTVEQNGQFRLLGNLYNVTQPNPAQASLFAKSYIGALDENGAKDVARRYAADILAQFGGVSLAGSRIFFVSDRSAPVQILKDGVRVTIKEIYVMDYDGSNQRQLTFYKSLSSEPAVSPDGKMFAFLTYPQKIVNGNMLDANPQIMVHSVDTDKKLNFYNPVSSVVAYPEFMPDGKHMLLGTKIGNDKDQKIYMTNLQGGDITPVSHVNAIEVEPKVNPKTGTEIMFISGRTGHPQLWRMNIDGSDARMLTDGTGDVSNPNWSPNGQWVAFSWTRGYTYGQFNIFVMNVVTGQIDQLTHDTGDNENPTWAPDGLHLAFASKKGKSSQIFTMLANGQHVEQLTTKGNNYQPVWTKGIN